MVPACLSCHHHQHLFLPDKGATSDKGVRAGPVKQLFLALGKLLAKHEKGVQTEGKISSLAIAAEVPNMQEIEGPLKTKHSQMDVVNTDASN